MTASEALQKSIEHWERLADSEPGEVASASSCALCQEFIDQGCVGCPVFKATGKNNCRGTPFFNVILAELDYGYNSDQFRAAARKELEFLQSLKA